MNLSSRKYFRGPRRPMSPSDRLIAHEVSERIKNGQYRAEIAQGLMSEMLRRTLEAILQGEMDAHLLTQNSPSKKRNGYSQKTVKTHEGPLTLSIPRDRSATFEPQIIPKHQRTLPKMNAQILAMYARGMSTRDIEALLREVYCTKVSPTSISAVTNRLSSEVEAWQSRPLASTYGAAFFDAMYVKVRDGAKVKNLAIYIGIGVKLDGTREVLGLWAGDIEKVEFWVSVFKNLCFRGVEEIKFIVTDGLQGMGEAIASVFPAATHQTCIVHLVRRSTEGVARQDRRAVCALLKRIYQAKTLKEAKRALFTLRDSPLGKRYPHIYEQWSREWLRAIPFFQFPEEVRHLLYTTNLIEGLNRAVRKVIKTRTQFPSKEAALKLIYLAIANFTENWKTPSLAWKKLFSYVD